PNLAVTDQVNWETLEFPGPVSVLQLSVTLDATMHPGKKEQFLVYFILPLQNQRYLILGLEAPDAKTATGNVLTMRDRLEKLIRECQTP
ncbi:MAG: hypothetical protein D6820_01340, partial [Lentisphaerae bacterium]